MSARPTIGVGVIGCGVIAYWSHLRSLRRLPGARLVAAVDPDPAARERAARLTGCETHADAAELLARPDVDAVVISAPTPLHAELGVAAAEAGKPFYLEKPAACDRAEAERLRAAVDRAGVSVAVGFNRRFHPLCIQARELIRSGALGRVRAVLGTFNEPLAASEAPSWKGKRRTGGGALLDLGSHHFDLVAWLLSDFLLEVEAGVSSRRTEDDEAWTRAATAGGVPVQSYFSFRAGRADWIEVLGESGTLRIDRHRSALDLRVARRFGYGLRAAGVPATRETLALRARRLVRPSYDPSYRAALAAFVTRLRGGSADLATLDDGLRSLDVVLAAEESSRAGRPVGIETTASSPQAP